MTTQPTSKRKTEKEPSKLFMVNAMAAAKAAGWSSVRITTPYGTLIASNGESDAEENRESNPWDA